MNKYTQGFALLVLIAFTFSVLWGCDRWQANAQSRNLQPVGFLGPPQIPDGREPVEFPTCCDEAPNPTSLDSPSPD